MSSDLTLAPTNYYLPKRVSSQIKRHGRTLKKVFAFWTENGRLPKRIDNKNLGYWCANVRGNQKSYNKVVYENLVTMISNKGEEFKNAIFGEKTTGRPSTKQKNTIVSSKVETADIMRCIDVCNFIQNKKRVPDVDSRLTTESNLGLWLLKKRYETLKTKKVSNVLVSIARGYQQDNLFNDE